MHRNPRLTPLSPRDVDLIRSRAAEAAVRHPNLGGPSSYHLRSRKAIETKLGGPVEAAPLPRLLLGLISTGHATMEDKKVIAVPTVRLVEGSIVRERKHRCRRGRSRINRSPPRYWQPPPNVGGNSQGYAYGCL